MRHPEPLGHRMEFSRWQDHGACTQVYRQATTKSQLNSLDLIFFGKPGRPALSRQYSEYCNDCPVRQLCLEDAIVHNPSFGVWGGMSKSQRQILMSRERAALVRVAIEEGWIDREILSEEDQRWVAQIERVIALEKQALERPREFPNPVFLHRTPRVLRIEAS